MGAAVARQLILKEDDLIVWNSSASKCEPLRELGAEVADAFPAAVDAADAVVLLTSHFDGRRICVDRHGHYATRSGHDTDDVGADELREYRTVAAPVRREDSSRGRLIDDGCGARSPRGQEPLTARVIAAESPDPFCNMVPPAATDGTQKC